MSVVIEDEECLLYTIPAALGEIETVCEKVVASLKIRNIGCHLDGVILVIREALTNAVKHGSRHGGDLEVVFSLKRRANALILKVADQGAGFDWRAHQGRAAKSGRGLELLRMYSDIVSFNEQGNEIKFIIFTD